MSREILTATQTEGTILTELDDNQQILVVDWTAEVALYVRVPGVNPGADANTLAPSDWVKTDVVFEADDIQSWRAVRGLEYQLQTGTAGSRGFLFKERTSVKISEVG